MSREHRLVRDLAAIERQLSQLLRSANLLSVNPEDPAARGQKVTWAPPIDIYETSEAFILTAEVPGVKSSDIDIKVIGETLLLRGERRWEPEAHQELYHRLESSYGKFERSFSLSESIDDSRIAAELDNGVLRLTLPKRVKDHHLRVQEIPVRSGKSDLT
ncbi:MAG: Hsp20/alpha crystallin family protein [Acidobacteria bacterium]|nr:Hsp20/alpha crystallin family protein [Acidobacteriota bacterium]